MAADSWRSDWITEKCAVAIALARGTAGGSYSEAAILVSAMLSALSAEVWPVRGRDRERFIELLIRLAPAADFARISVPLLVQYLEATSQPAPAKLLADSLLPSSASRVVTGSVDRSETELLSVCPSLRHEPIRTFSYASLFYKEVRSSYAHEYRPGARADSWPVSRAEGESVSYVNRLVGLALCETERLIHFHIEWLTSMAIGIAGSIDGRRGTVPLPPPSVWWIDGAP